MEIEAKDSVLYSTQSSSATFSTSATIATSATRASTARMLAGSVQSTMGSFELMPVNGSSANNPYIDFHYQNTSTNYTHRIIADNDTSLHIINAINTSTARGNYTSASTVRAALTTASTARASTAVTTYSTAATYVANHIAIGSSQTMRFIFDHDSKSSVLSLWLYINGSTKRALRIDPINKEFRWES